MPDNADLSLYQGDDYAATCTIRNLDGTPADLTGYTAQAQIRTAVADAQPVVAAEFETNIVSPDVHLFLSHDVTVTLGVGTRKYVWDLQVTDAGGMVTTVLAGKVLVTQEVTREMISARQLVAVVA